MELFITINPDETPFPLTLNEIRAALIDTYPFDKDNLSFTLCREVATHEHYHIYLKDSKQECPNGKLGDKIRNKIRRYVRSVISGEVRISKRQVEETARAIAYTMKDGNYVTHRIDWLVWLKAKTISHPKKNTYKDRMSDFYQNVSTKSEEKLVSELLDIHDEFDIIVDTQRIAKMVRLSRLKQKDSDYRKRLIERIVSEI